MTRRELKRKLQERGQRGLDMSPGDPVDKAALEYIEHLEKALRLEKSMRRGHLPEM